MKMYSLSKNRKFFQLAVLVETEGVTSIEPPQKRRIFLGSDSMSGFLLRFQRRPE